MLASVRYTVGQMGLDMTMTYYLLYRKAKVLMGPYGVKMKNKGIQTCMIKVHSGSYGAGCDNH